MIWRGEFLGGDLLWVSALFLATGVIYSQNHTYVLREVENESDFISAHVTARFILNVCSAGIAVEKVACYRKYSRIYSIGRCALPSISSINTPHTERSVSKWMSEREHTVSSSLKIEYRFIGQLVLICITTGIYGAALLTSLWGAILYGRETVAARKAGIKSSPGISIGMKVLSGQVYRSPSILLRRYALLCSGYNWLLRRLRTRQVEIRAGSTSCHQTTVNDKSRCPSTIHSSGSATVRSHWLCSSYRCVSHPRL